MVRGGLGSQVDPLGYAYAAWGGLPAAGGEEGDPFADYRRSREPRSGFAARRLAALGMWPARSGNGRPGPVRSAGPGPPEDVADSLARALRVRGHRRLADLASGGRPAPPGGGCSWARRCSSATGRPTRTKNELKLIREAHAAEGSAGRPDYRLPVEAAGGM